MSQIDVTITPKIDALRAHGLTEADFNAALDSALQDLEGQPTHRLPRPLEILLTVAGQQLQLGDLACIRVLLDADLERTPA